MHFHICMHLQCVLFEAGPGQAIIMHHQTVHGVGPNHSETAWELSEVEVCIQHA